MSTSSPLERLEPHLSEPRLRPYLTRARSDPELALELYVWNSQLAAAFAVDLGHLEVALRNALDARMTSRHNKLGLPGLWLDDPSGELGRTLDDLHPTRHAQPYREIAAARRRVINNRKPSTHDQILSETSFGLWRQLTASRWSSLWPDLADAFPHAPDHHRETLAAHIGELHDLRNRISHHHCIWPLHCARHHAELLRVAGYIDPYLREWIRSGSTVPTVIDAAPRARRRASR